MAIETERKFLVSGDGFRAGRPVRILQGYICSSAERVVRVRVKGDSAFLTIKDATVGFSRHEFEYEIPVDDARQMLQSVCIQPVIDKTRWVLDYGGYTWEVDEFHADNEGLIVAEIELEHSDADFPHPDWLAGEVTGIERYYNACLFSYPFSRWTDDERSNTLNK